MNRARPLLTYISNNFGLKLVSLAVSFAVFAFVRGSDTQERTVSVGVVATLPEDASGKILLTAVPERIVLRLRATRSALHAVASGDLPDCELDLREAPHTVDLSRMRFELPSGVEILSVRPGTLHMDWATRDAKEVRLEPAFVGTPERGALVPSSIRVLPPTATLVGPAFELRSIRRVTTTPIDISGLSLGEHERRLTVATPAPHSSVRDVNQVTVAFSIGLPRATRRFAHVAISIPGRRPTELRPRIVAVSVAGPESLVQAIREDDLIAVVEPGAQGAGTVARVEIRNLPAGVEASVDPPQVFLRMP